MPSQTTKLTKQRQVYEIHVYSRVLFFCVGVTVELYSSPKYTIVVTRNSNEERLLVRTARYQEQLHLVDSLDEGLSYAGRNADVVVATDSVVADNVAEKVNDFLVCCI